MKIFQFFVGCIALLYIAFFFSFLSFANPSVTADKPADVNYNGGNADVDVSTFAEFSPSHTVGELAQRVLNFLMAILGGLGVLGMVAGSVMVMSGGVSEQTKENGKDIIFYSVIGISIALLSIVITTLAQSFFYSLGT